MKRPPLILALAFGALTVSCSGDDGGSGACAEGERRLAILEPADGAMLTSADDIDPDMGNVQIQVTVSHCGFEVDDQIAVYLLDPVETPYAFVEAGTGDTSTTIVPLVPGTLRMQARSMDESVTSTTVTIDVTLD